MKKLLILLLALLFSCAQADGLVVEPYAGGIAYRFQAEEEFLVLKCKTDMESVRCTVYSEDGAFSGEIALMHTFGTFPVRVTVETLKGYQLLSERTETIAVAQSIPLQALADETECRKLSDVGITPLLNAIQYRFRAPGRASLLLKYRSSTESGTVTIYAGEDYVYDGVLRLPYTYHNSNVVLTVSDMRNCNDLYEVILRTDYPVPDAPKKSAGRLTGITVCIDPGHQENGQYIVEEKGPGLEGTVRSSAGMARGAVTKRMESIVVLEIGFMLRDALLAEGATIIMTRNTQDTYVSNIRRAEIAAEADADFLLRLHCDAHDTQETHGIGIYCPVYSDYAKAIADWDGWLAMGDIMRKAMWEATGQTRGRTALTNLFIGNNWATMPSFLIEMGFMTNPAEDVLLSFPPYQQRLVQGMVEGVYNLAVHRGLIP